MTPVEIAERDAILQAMDVDRFREWLSRVAPAKRDRPREVLLMAMHKMRIEVRKHGGPISPEQEIESTAWLAKNGWLGLPGTIKPRGLVKPR